MFRWVAIGLVVVLAIGAAWYFLAGGGPKIRSKRTQCAGLRADLAAAQARGDANAVASLTLQIAECDKSLSALGDTGVDPFGNQLSTCVASFDLINASLSDIVSTDRSDWLKRGNIWRNALHFATDAVSCLASLAGQATTKEDLATLRTSVLAWGKRMRATQNRLYASSHGGESGLDAYSGSPEPGGDDKSHAWKIGVVDPMWAMLKTIDTKLTPLDPANAALTAELAAIAATDSPPANGVFGP